MQVGDVQIQLAHTGVLDPAVLDAAHALLHVVFPDDLMEEDWEHSLGGMHAIAWDDDTVVGHASVVQRRLVHGGRALRTGYVEGVGVHPDWQRRGIGGRMMAALEDVIARAYDIGALGASDDAIPMYEQRGWKKWLGRAWALTPDGIVRTAEEEG